MNFPSSLLNPVHPIGRQIAESIVLHKKVSYKEAKKTGGQRQRIGIARALALQPKLIVCDEPVSALDVSIQAQILNLLKEIQKDMGLSYLFIAHGIQAVKHISDKIAVMYLGRIAELAEKEALFENPHHPYTKALLSAVPLPNPKLRDRERIILKGDLPSPANPPTGCRFHTRCPVAMEKCKSLDPSLIQTSKNTITACLLFEDEGSTENKMIM
ncbi:ABC transporter ATP-binding protein [Neobacillus niacini]|uniref:ABC transporter ATP-binding protein n=1 Tax=Neobacillus niacini TaxID=86668 RepID=UPI0028895163|nr:ABC transporter ATP-binding protein [Neobacillus niacini]